MSVWFSFIVFWPVSSFLGLGVSVWAFVGSLSVPCSLLSVFSELVVFVSASSIFLLSLSAPFFSKFGAFSKTSSALSFVFCPISLFSAAWALRLFPKIENFSGLRVFQALG